MKLTLIIHILAGTIALISGYIALYSRKGATTHRKAGMAFVWSMLAMAGFGALVAAMQGNRWSSMNVSAGLLTGYFVFTGWTTVRPLAKERAVLLAGLLLASVVASTDLVFGMQALGNGGSRNGVPAFPFLMFGTVGMLGVIGDLKVLRFGPLQGTKRLSRHLWRMTYALFVAAMSFFIGQAKVIPEPLRIRPLLAIPVVAVLVTLFYWMWRVKRPSRKPSVVSTPSAVSA